MTDARSASHGRGAHRAESNLLVAALGGLELGDESPSIVGTLVAAVAQEEGWGASGPAGFGIGYVFSDA
jgi:hypothetical protein